MKLAHRLALVGLTTVGLALVSGFPKRIGLTASEAAVSLPGDLLLPGADVVVDRGIRIDAPVDRVWRILDAAFEEDDEGRLLAKEENDCLVLSVPTPGFEDEDRTGTCVLALLPLPNGRTLLHLRERHFAGPEAPRALLYAMLGAESPSAMRMLADVKRAASRG